MEKREQERKKIKEMQVSRVRVVKIRSEEPEQQVYMKKALRSLAEQYLESE